MKICICTTPIRPYPTSFPPFGSMVIIQSLRKIGADVNFFHIDFHRPTEQEVMDYFKENQFDVIGISSVVSTAYAYTKKLSNWIRMVSPQTIIIVGGNLAASAEVLLKKSEVDYCVIGDGELIIQNLIKVLQKNPLDNAKLENVEGISFLDQDGEFHFTGYSKPLPKDSIDWPDYRILEDNKSLDYYISSNFDSDFFDILLNENHKEKKFTTIISAKGCVARCTFCHRWEKGYRARPADQIFENIKYLKTNYNVGYIGIGDENFGSDKKMTESLVNRLGELDIKWRVGGVRVRTVNPEILKFWKDNGCLIVIYGIESGSQKMLDVMEKNATVQANIDALKWTYEAGLFTVPQLVIGMPGEDDQTIAETIGFLKTITPYMYLNGKHPSKLISLNYAQSLPGTPLYEYAREHGLIGKSIDEEERYLYQISDTDAYSTDHFVNYTNQPLLKVLLWRYWILASVDAHYLQYTYGCKLSLFNFFWIAIRGLFLMLRGSKKRYFSIFAKLVPSKFLDIDPLSRLLPKKTEDNNSDLIYFNIQSSRYVYLFLNPLIKRFFYPFLAFRVAIDSAQARHEFFELIKDHFKWSFKLRISGKARKEFKSRPNNSLRKEMSLTPLKMDVVKEDKMIPLRLGR